MKSAKKDHFFKVVVVGGGLGGVVAALKLSKNKKCSVTLVSETDHPVMHAAVSETTRHLTSRSLSDIFAKRKVRVVQDSVVGIDTSRKVVVGRQQQYEYDTVIFALGVVVNYFGMDKLADDTMRVQSHDDIRRLRQQLHDGLTEKHVAKQYFVIGGGPSGVELAASLQEYLNDISSRHGLRQHRTGVTLVEAASRLLPQMSEVSSRHALTRLCSLGAEVLLGTTAKKLDDSSLAVGQHEVPVKRVIWTAGVSNHPFFEQHSEIFRRNERGFVTGNEYLEGIHDIFVIGHNTATPYNGHSRTAIYDGKYVAKVIARRLSGVRPPLYMPKRRVTSVPLGRGWAIWEHGPLRLAGKSAATLGKITHAFGYSPAFPIKTTRDAWNKVSQDLDSECELCQKNNDSSRVAPNS